MKKVKIAKTYSEIIKLEENCKRRDKVIWIDLDSGYNHQFIHIYTDVIFRHYEFPDGRKSNP